MEINGDLKSQSRQSQEAPDQGEDGVPVRRNTDELNRRNPVAGGPLRDLGGLTLIFEGGVHQPDNVSRTGSEDYLGKSEDELA